ncbi:MAG: histidine kinase [Bacteroidales bacterium]|nr:histidine kinase [Bacteroidales bacterium]
MIIRVFKRKEYIIHSIIWIVGLIIVAGSVQTIGNVKREMGDFIYPVALGTIFSILLFYTVSNKLIGLYSLKKSNYLFLGQVVVTLLGLTIIETVLDYSLFPAYYSTEIESLYSQFVVTLVFNLFVLAIALGYGFIKMWLKSERQKQELKSQKLSAELDFLKAQVNPHVLFNMLNMAFSSATTYGDERTADIIEKTSSQLRYVLYDSNTDKVSIRKEIDHIEGFVALQKMRISADMPVKISLNVSTDNENYQISPLLLIPFIENAFKYGISFNRPTEINIEIQCRENTLQLLVRNPIITDDTSQRRDGFSGIGLENVRKRLSILYPSNHILKISNDGEIFIVNLTLNLK